MAGDGKEPSKDEKEEAKDESGLLRFAQEWPLELGGEVGTASLERMPIVPDRVEIAALLAGPDPLESLAFRTLYETGLREAEFLQLDREQLRDGFLEAAGRRVLIREETLADLHQLPEGQLWSWDVAGLRKRLRARARQTGLIKRYEGVNRKLLPAMFRHACGVHMVENGMDIFAIKALLGHSSIYTSLRVAEMAVGLCRESYERFHPLAKVPATPIKPKRDARSPEPGEERPTKAKPADLSLADIAVLFRAAKDDREILLSRLFYASGMRVSSAAALCYLDIFYGERRLFLREAKGDVDLYVLIDQGTAEMLRMYQDKEPIRVSLFDGIGTRQMNRLISDMGERSGLQAIAEPLGRSISPHCFRHAFATHCYEAGMKVYDIQKLLGHADLATTNDYVAQRFERHQTLYRSMEPL